jgi:hypothetical protein
MFFKKNLLGSKINADLPLRGLWLTATQLYPSLHGSSAYIRNLSKALGGKVKLDLAYFIYDEDYKKNPRIYQPHFLNIFHIPRPPLNGINPLHSGLNTYTSIISPNLVQWIKEKFSSDIYDFIVCDYVYLAPVFDFLPDNVVKIINTHDVYGNRHLALNWTEFEKKSSFCISTEDEDYLLKRADIIISITNKEKQIFMDRLKSYNLNMLAICVKYYPNQNIQRKPSRALITKNQLSIGFLGSSNPINTDGINSYIRCLSKLDMTGVTFTMAGLICYKIKDDYPWLIKKYELKNEELQQFYDSLDLIVNPMPQKTTGLKIKSIESIINNIPIIGTLDAFTGLDTKCKWHSAASIEELAGLTMDIFNKPDMLNEIYKEGSRLKNQFLLDSNEELKSLYSAIKSKKSEKSEKKLFSQKKLPDSHKNYNKKLSTVISDYVGSLEIAKSRIDLLVTKLDDFSSYIKPNYQGYVSIMSSYGLYQDSWCQKKCILTYIAKRRISSIQLSIFNPNILLGDITISQQNTKETFEISKKNTLIKFECSVDINTSNNLKIISNLNSTNESDSRQLSYLLASIIFD